MWKQTTKIERNLKIFKEEIEEFLPLKVLDFHIHICPKEAVSPEGYCVNAGGNKLREYTMNKLKEDLKSLYPGRDCYGVCFGTPQKKGNTVKNNEYVAGSCDRKRFFPLRLLRPEESPKTVEEDIAGGKFFGFKPYCDYVKKTDPEDAEIKDMLPERFMQIADRYGLIIMLHIPKTNRLADPSNQKQIVSFCERYPRAKIVLAHIGRAYYFKNIYRNLGDIKQFPNLYFELAMLNNSEVLEYLFENIEPYKILYGTDIPIALAAGKSVEINDQYAYVTPIPWELSISDDHRKIVFTSFAYEEIRAIKKAVKRVGLSEKSVEDIFFNNGYQLLNSVKG